MIHFDLETRSTVDLRKTGSWAYAENAEVLCLAYYDSETGAKGLWFPGQPVPQVFLREDQTFAAWNARFERDIYRHVLQPQGFPPTVVEQWSDPSTVARLRGYPAGLGAASKLLGLSVDEQKDNEGRKLMLQMSKPRRIEDGQPIWWMDPERMQKLTDYCAQDVVAEVAIHRKLGDLPKSEQHLMWLDQHINDRGVRIDQTSAEKLIKVMERQEQLCNRQILKLTQGQIEKVTAVSQIMSWLESRSCFGLSDLSSSSISSILPSIQDPIVRQVLQLRLENAKTSTAKLRAMLSAVASDGRVHGLMYYYGAHTGRFSSRLVQLQNLPKGIGLTADQVEDLLSRLHSLNSEEWLEHVTETHGSPMRVISSLIRAMIVPREGYRFFVYDYASIEPRVLAWVSGQQDLLQAYIKNEDAYKLLAAKIYRKSVAEISKEERQFGKMAVLGAGYQMGYKRFAESCTAMGLDVTEEEAQNIIETYRNNFSDIQQFWWDSGQAAWDAFETPDNPQLFGYKDRLSWYRKDGTDILELNIPSGRTLYYPDAHIQPNGGFGGNDSLNYRTSINNKWLSKSLWGGLITENVVQALARDLMVDAMMRLESNGYPIVFSVHDEIVCEVSERYGSPEEFEALMTQVPTWAEGIPVGVEGNVIYRYAK